MMKSIAALLFFCFSCASFAQEIKFQPYFGRTQLILNQYYKIPSGDSLQITAFRFYISDLEFLQKGKIVWKEPNSYHLVDAEIEESLRIFHPFSGSFDQMRFNFGIDSLTNVSGAMGGDLDPTLGMYWTWQSGYINFKLEGKSNLCATRNQVFQFHLGGYQDENNALQQITLDILQYRNIAICLNLEEWFEQLNLAQQNQIMSPCKEAVLLAKAASDIFKIK